MGLHPEANNLLTIPGAMAPGPGELHWPAGWALYSQTGFQSLWKSWLCKHSPLGNSEQAEAQAQAPCTALGQRPPVMLLSDPDVQSRAVFRSGEGYGFTNQLNPYF